jgi:hypothetical protein
MKTTLISIPPRCCWRPISTLMLDWREQLGELIQERKPIAFDFADMEPILKLEPELTSQGYEHQILGSDLHQHFLVPV